MSALALPRRRGLAIPAVKLPAWTLALFVALAGGISALAPARDPDVGWHLRSGQTILATHAIPRVDTFSHTMAGTPWADFEWLWETSFAAVYSIGGFVGAIAMNGIIVTLILLLVAATQRLRGASWFFAAAGSCFALANLFIYSELRPGMTGALLSATFLFILELARRREQPRLAFFLVPLEALWANAHGSYALGPILCLVYGAAECWETRSRRTLVWWAGLGAALVSATLVNPMGLGLLRFTLGASHMSYNRDHNGEWVPPDLHELWALPLLITLLLSLGLPLLFRNVRPSRREALLLLTATLAVLQSNQFIPLYSVAAAPMVARMVEQAFNRELRLRLPAIAGAIAAAELLLATAHAVAGLQPDEYRAAIAKSYPVDAVSYIEQHQLQGPIFNHFSWGCYLMTALPRLPVFVDGRTEMYGEEFLRRFTDATTGAKPAAPLLDEYGVNLVLVPRESTVAVQLRQSGGWREDYTDSLAAVFSREQDASLS